MEHYVVILDTGASAADSPDLIQAVESFEEYIQLSETDFIISTRENAACIYGRLKPVMNERDRVYVFELEGHFSGRGPADIIDWLTANVQSEVLR